MKFNIKYFIVFLFFLLIWGPLIQDTLHLFKGGELKGAYKKPDDVNFDFTRWLNGDYAPQKANYLGFSFGFRPDFVRLYDQLNYWFFSTSPSHVIIGKNDYFFDTYNASSYFGQDFAGEDVIRNRVSTLKVLQDTLKEHGILLFVAIAPNKGSFYPEYFPDNIKVPRNRTNYDAYTQYFKQDGIAFIDFSSWFLSMKGHSPYPLFSRAGAHWSYYGEYLCFDSMSRYIAKQTGVKMPLLKIDSIQTSLRPRFRDYDEGEAMNLISEFYKDTLGYPLFSTDTTKTKINLMVVGDSFFYGQFGWMVSCMYKQSTFWYYFHDLCSSGPPPDANKEKVKQVVLQQNVLCLMYSDGTMYNFGNGFIEKALSKFQAAEPKDSSLAGAGIH